MFTSTLFTIFCAAIVSVHGIPGSQSPGASCPSTEQLYVIRAGDTCTSIANQFGTTLQNIIAVNQPAINSNCSNLLPGQLICVPA
ncbi:carbohydrate-binding module family 50 protein [Macrolepiota fuliginosa MF-IS2]|uniref:Carbohydrate-binding module family 50 protein n=1 Tax=Macrolepiota fuliginosa MF-IS2 TaxID=1400762 RepID=A0A9P5XDS6_9AGAR|nr:carbohydrate-binding module family 50 protein [Macrolepiota fuliginosa MF-IS2]